MVSGGRPVKPFGPALDIMKQVGAKIQPYRLCYSFMKRGAGPAGPAAGKAADTVLDGEDGRLTPRQRKRPQQAEPGLGLPQRYPLLSGRSVESAEQPTVVGAIGERAAFVSIFLQDVTTGPDAPHD